MGKIQELLVSPSTGRSSLALSLHIWEPSKHLQAHKIWPGLCSIIDTMDQMLTQFQTNHIWGKKLIWARPKIVIYAIVFLISGAPRCFAADLRCQTALTGELLSDLSRLSRLSKYEDFLFEFKWQLDSILGIELKSTYSELSAGAVYRRLLTAKSFLEFVRNNSNWVQSTISHREQERLLALFVDQLVHHYSGATLDKLQADRLLTELKWRGLQSNLIDGRAALDEVSRTNRERLISQLTFPISVTSEIQIAVNSVRFYFVHNTMSFKSLHVAPLFSSEVLEELGYDGGENTAPYNKYELRSNGNVFFMVYVVGGNSEFVAPSTEYGRNSQTLDNEYAASHAWISPYIMYPEDQYPVVSRIVGGQYRTNIVYDNGISGEIVLKDTGQVIPKLPRQVLHKMDFNLNDFEFIVRSALASELEDLRTTNLNEYKRSLDILTGKDAQASIQLTQKVMHERLGFPDKVGRGAELKVPVAVPAKSLKSTFLLRGA